MFSDARAPGTQSTDVPGDALPSLIVEVRDGLAWVTLNRPAALNALDQEVMDGLLAVLDSLARDRSVRCVGLRGAGRAFCAGGDLSLIEQRREEAAAAPSPGTVIDAQHRALAHQVKAAQILREMPKPTIAAIHGHAVGGGLALALACDVRVVAEDAKLRAGFAARSLSGDYGISFLLVHTVGSAKARELLLLDPTIDGVEAHRLGLATVVCASSELRARTDALGRQLADGPTIALGRMKDNILWAETTNLERVLQVEALNQRVSVSTSDAEEAGRAFAERRAPRFTGN